MPESGGMGRAMGLGCRAVLMGAAMLGNSSVGSSMDSGVIISGEDLLHSSFLCLLASDSDAIMLNFVWFSVFFDRRDRTLKI